MPDSSIPSEAVEAGARAMVDRQFVGPVEDLPDDCWTLVSFRDHARTCLEAALPHLTLSLSDEELDALADGDVPESARLRFEGELGRREGEDG